MEVIEFTRVLNWCQRERLRNMQIESSFTGKRLDATVTPGTAQFYLYAGFKAIVSGFRWWVRFESGKRESELPMCRLTETEWIASG
jgi:hypothetical protein